MRLAPSLVAIAVLVGSLPALAAAVGDQIDVSRGEALARSWCAECHAVGRGQQESPRKGVPSFTTVARQLLNSEAAVHAFLTTPHPSMPNIKLTRDQLGDIADYILSLKEAR
jgi:mono/diheme cytochrome c family protein